MYKYLDRDPKSFSKREKNQSDNKIACKCGHRILMGLEERKVCNWCGNYVYRNKEIEFKYKLKEKMMKN